MEEKNLSNQESLDLIRKMLEQTRESVQSNGNMVEMWGGCLGAAISISIYIGITVTGNNKFFMLYLLMFLMFFISRYYSKKQKMPETYLAKAIGKAYQVMGYAMGLASVIIVCESIFINSPKSSLVLFPLSLILMSFVTILKGILLKEKLFSYTGIVALLLSIWMLKELILTQRFQLSWTLFYACICIVMWVIPNFLMTFKTKSNERA